VLGIFYLAAFSFIAMGSWAQQSGIRITGAAAVPDPTGQSRQLEEIANEINQREDMTRPAMQRPTVTCILQPYPGLSNTVSARSLALPEKMQDEYQRACMALKSKKGTEAEKHLRKALRYSPDALGWVMLGRLLEVMERWDEAAKACAEAVIQDPYYWPADVCLAEINAYQQKWKEAVEASNRAVSLSQESKRFASYISAFALLNLQQLSDAESRALEAAKLDGDHQLPGLGLLLVRIHQVKGDIADLEVDRINEKVASNGSEERQQEAPVLLADRR
jgi:tetratricopeptide (TPR) repeat protein